MYDPNLKNADFFEHFFVKNLKQHARSLVLLSPPPPSKPFTKKVTNIGVKVQCIILLILEICGTLSLTVSLGEVKHIQNSIIGVTS